MRRLLCLMTLLVGLLVQADDTLYTHLGGHEGIAAITDQLVDRSAADPATRRSFQKVDLDRLKRLLTEQLCALSGGPEHYGGDTMREAHAGLGINQSEFYGMVDHLRAILDARGVAQADKNALLAKLAPMQRDVIDLSRP